MEFTGQIKYVQTLKLILIGIACLNALSVCFPAERIAVGSVQILIDHNSGAHPNPGFYFGEAPRPCANDAGSNAIFSILEGQAAANSGGLEALHDGKVPPGFDSPHQNFFFKDDGTDGGLVRVDLGQIIPVKAINTYSCHPSNRAPQIYTVYASDGQEPNLVLTPRRGDDLEKQGWKQIAAVATGMRGDFGGQWAVVISSANGSLGRFRYLLFDIHNPQLNTFYSEIDIIAEGSSCSLEPETIQSWKAGDYKVTIDTSDEPELTEWTRGVLGSIVQQWYSNIVALLPSDGFKAPRECGIEFHYMGPVTGQAGQVVAFAQGTRITCSSEWFRKDPLKEAVGCVVHEMVHVVQQYGARADDRGQEGQPPGWLVEGIADYVRWFLFEPQSHGAEITRDNLSSAHYDASYRITANFLNWVVKKYGQAVIVKLNAAARQNDYHEALWEKLTGKTVQVLDHEWRADLEKEIQGQPKDEQELKNHTLLR